MKKLILGLSVLLLLLAAVPVLTACGADEEETAGVDCYGFARPESCWLTECLILPEAVSAEEAFGTAGRSGLVSEAVLARNGQLNGNSGYLVCLIYGTPPKGTEISTQLSFSLVSGTQVLRDEECVSVDALSCFDCDFDGTTALNMFSGATLDMAKPAGERLDLPTLDRGWTSVQGMLTIPFTVNSDAVGTLYVECKLHIEGVSENYFVKEYETAQLGSAGDAQAYAEVSGVSVGYLSESAYQNGDYTAESIQAEPSFVNGEYCYLVLDFTVAATADNDGGHTLYVLTHVSDRAVMGVTVEEAPTGKIHQAASGNIIAIYAAYSVPAKAGESKTVRMLIRLQPISAGKVDVGVFFSGTEGMQVGGTPYTLKEFETGAPSLTYTLSEDGTYYTVTGVAGSVVSIPDTLGDGLPVLAIQEGLFRGNTEITSLTVGGMMTVIRDSEFRGCTSLCSVTIRDTVTSIGENAFSGCTALETLSIGKGVTSIGKNAFYGCTSLQKIYYNAVASKTASSKTNGQAVFPERMTAAVTVGSAVEQVPSYLFYRCRITSLDFEENGVKLIGERAFSYCTSLTSVTVNAGTVDEYAFANCSGLQELTIGDRVSVIGDFAFAECRALTSIAYRAAAAAVPFNETSSASTGSVWQNAGADGDGITVTVGANVSSIPRGLFWNKNTSYAPKIVSVIFEEGSHCYWIGESAFHDCADLTSVTLPDSIQYIDAYAFRQCTNLTAIHYTGTTAQWEDRISKGELWASYTILKVVCSDGEVSLN